MRPMADSDAMRAIPWLNPGPNLIHHRRHRTSRQIKSAEASGKPMSAYKSDFLNVLATRGFIHQLSDAAGLDARAARGEITAYVGFDATAASLHIGNLRSTLMLRWLPKTAHPPTPLMGARTSQH